MGYTVWMDENGDAEGNYTLLAKGRIRNTTELGLIPVGRFHLNLNHSSSRLPHPQLKQEILWPGGSGPPVDQPSCGFHGENCTGPSYLELILGVVGGVVSVLLIVGGVAYRNYR